MKTILITIILMSFNFAHAYTASKSSMGRSNENDPRLRYTEYGRIYDRMLDAYAGQYQYEANHLWSGRCYQKSNPNRPVAAALVFRLDYYSDIEVASVWNLQAHPSYFDTKWPHQVSAYYQRPYYDGRRNAYYLQLNTNSSSAIRRDHYRIYEAVLNSYNETVAICEYSIRN